MVSSFNRLRARRASPASRPDAWTPPEIEGGFHTAIGSSVVDEFVAGHSLADVLRELVQNEFDAGGSSLTITFSDKALTILGNGRPIDSKGWARLSAILGTGRVVGDRSGPDYIPPKENGIGSKNFGLRSLFLIGNRIHVRSNGKIAVLDLSEMGTVKLPDPESRGQRGVLIYVPFRSEPFHNLKAFTPERDREAFDGLADDLLAALTKLALTGRKTGIKSVNIRSERTGQRVSWNQSAKPVRSRLKGVSCLRRSGRLRHVSTADGSNRRQNVEELEFSRIVPIPAVHSDARFPPYFRARDGVKVCVSLQMRGDRIDRTRRGTFFYPLAAGDTDTGTIASISAPFHLDSDRSKLLDSDWNEWLSKQAARLAMDLLVGDWLARFGSDAFLATNPGDGRPGQFAATISGSLRAEACWPTRARNGRSTEFAKAEDIVVPTHRALDGYLSDNRYLDDRTAADPQVIEMARRFGAKPFSLNSLVRLRCASADKSDLETSTGNDADFHYTEYDEALCGVDLQVRMAEALTTEFKRLSNQNRRDLKTTESTLAADGSLQAAERLVRIEPSIWAACPIAQSQRLHPRLLEHKAIANLCKSFDVNNWVRELAGQAAEGEIDDDDREALYSYLLNNGATISRTALYAAKHSPVVKDHRGDWVSPNSLLQLPKTQFDVLEQIVSAPARDLIGSSAFFKRLQVRHKLRGEDLIAMAEFVVDHPERAESFEQLLARQLPLLTRQTVQRLRNFPFLPSRAGTLERPMELHLSTTVNEACLNDAALFVGSANVPLYRKLDCRAHPTSKALLDALEQRRDQGLAPNRPDIFYPALVEALRIAKVDPTEYEDEPILFVDGTYQASSQTLVGPQIPSYFRFGVPHFTGPETVGRAYGALGASRNPEEQHWGLLLQWFASQCASGTETLSKKERSALRDAYRCLGRSGLPDGLDDDVRCLLSKDGTLHSLSELRDATYLENDYPELAAALLAADAGIAFADVDPRSIAFFRQIRLGKLSRACGEHLDDVEPECEPPSWFRSRREKALNRVRKHEFAAALADMAWNQHRNNGDFEPTDTKSLERCLSEIECISCVTDIRRVHRLAGISVSVPSEAAMVEDRIAMLRPRSPSDFDHRLALGLAEATGASRVSDIRTFAVFIIPLLQCRTKTDMRSYLQRQGIQPGTWSRGDDELEELEPPPNDNGSNTEGIVRGLVEGLGLGQLAGNAQHSNAQTSGNAPPKPPTPPTPTTPTLPPIDEVQLQQTEPSEDWTASGRVSSGGVGGVGHWTPPTPRDVDRDKQMGDRGEELVYRQEVERVRSLGYESPEDFVVWTSKNDPGADHDIRSIDENGEPLWIEVKSTTGTDGYFEWPRREFEKALRSGNSYEIWRVYQVHTMQPTARRFRNPISMLSSSRLGLQLGSVKATVEPLEA